MVNKLNLEGLGEKASEPFKAEGVDYIITEPSESATKQYRARQMKGAKKVNGEVVRDKPEELADLPAFFVSLCVTTASDKKAVPQSTVESWGSRLIARLHDWLLQFIIEPADTEKSLLKEREAIDKRLEAVRAGANDPKD